METKRYNAYNSTRGTVLNAKLGVADRDLEPLKFMELLIGGLGLDSESGIWLKPLAGVPQVPRVFPFDLVYLDQNHRVVQTAEIFPGREFPSLNDEVVSALVLPLHAVSSTQTDLGDQLLVSAADEAAELPSVTSEQGSEVLPGTSESASEPALAVNSTATIEQTPEAAAEITEIAERPQDAPAEVPKTSVPLIVEVASEDLGVFVEPAKAPEKMEDASPQMTEAAPLPIVEAGLPAQHAKAPEHISELTQQPEEIAPALIVEAVDKVPDASPEPGDATTTILESSSPDSSAKDSSEADRAEAAPDTSIAEASGTASAELQSRELSPKELRATEDPAKETPAEPEQKSQVPDITVVPDAPVSPTPVAAVPVATATAASLDLEARKPAATATPLSGAVVQNVDFTVAKFGSWHVSTSTIPAPAPKSGRSQSRKARTKDSPNSTPAITEGGEGRTKPGGRTSRAAQPTQTVPDAVPQPEKSPSQRPESSQHVSSSAAENKSHSLDEISAPLTSPTDPASPIEQIPPSSESVPETSVGLLSFASDPVAKRKEFSLPLWKAAAAAAPPAGAPSKSPDASRSNRVTSAQAKRNDLSTPLFDSSGKAEKPKPSVNKTVENNKTAEPRPSGNSRRVEEPVHPESHPPGVPDALSRLVTALHRIGSKPETQSDQRTKEAGQEKPSSLINAEALHRDRRRAVRRTIPGMVAFYFTGGAPQPYVVADISATGFYLSTRDQWMPETMIQMTLQKPSTDGKQRKESITVLTRIVRRSKDGVGAEFVMPEMLSHHHRDIKPDRATDRMALARFLLLDECPERFEELNLLIMPSAEQQSGA
jgi:hypothetical protein